MDTVLCRPWSDEVEDYVEYKRIRKQYRDKQNAPASQTSTALTISSDGAFEYSDSTSRVSRKAEILSEAWTDGEHEEVDMVLHEWAF